MTVQMRVIKWVGVMVVSMAAWKEYEMAGEWVG